MARKYCEVVRLITLHQRVRTFFSSGTREFNLIFVLQRGCLIECLSNESFVGQFFSQILQENSLLEYLFVCLTLGDLGFKLRFLELTYLLWRCSLLYVFAYAFLCVNFLCDVFICRISSSVYAALQPPFK